MNLLDWSNKNIVAVALGECIYLWNGDTGEVEQLEGVSYDDVVITSLSWADKGRFLAIGLDNGSIQVNNLTVLNVNINGLIISCMILTNQRRLEQ